MGNETSLDDLWAQQEVRFFNNDSPGDPPEEQQDPPPFFWEYRTVPNRWALPRGEEVLSYDVTIRLVTSSGGSVRDFTLGESPYWVGRPDPQLALENPDLSEAQIRNLEFESEEEFGYNDQSEGNFVFGNQLPPFTVGYAEEYWKEGFLKFNNPGFPVGVAVETDGAYFEPWDTSDTENFKVTREPVQVEPEFPEICGEVPEACVTFPSFDDPEVKLPILKQDVQVMLVPQFWSFDITWTGWLPVFWASPNHRIGLEKPFEDPPAPTVALAGLGAGNLALSDYYYAVSWETSEGVESRIGFSASIGITSPSTNGQVKITNIPVGPENTVKRHLYRTPELGDPDHRDEFQFLTTIDNNSPGQEFIDNTPDSGLGATAPFDFVFAFGNSKPNDWFFAEDGVTYDPVDGTYSGSVADDKDPGFYYCVSGTGETWDDWDFCSASDGIPPISSCFSRDLVSYRTAQIQREFEISGFKRGLSRPVFLDSGVDSLVFSSSDEWPKLAVEFQPGTPFESEDPVPSPSEELAAIDYSSIVVLEELAVELSQRSLNRWAENSSVFREYFNDSNFPSSQYLVDVGLADSKESEEFDGPWISTIQGVDGSLDPGQITVNQPDYTSDHILNLFNGTNVWWTDGGQLVVGRKDTPAGCLVGAIRIGQTRFYVWRKTASTGRTGDIVTVPFDSIKEPTRDDAISISSVAGPAPSSNFTFQL